MIRVDTSLVLVYVAVGHVISGADVSHVCACVFAMGCLVLTEPSLHSVLFSSLRHCQRNHFYLRQRRYPSAIAYASSSCFCAFALICLRCLAYQETVHLLVTLRANPHPLFPRRSYHPVGVQLQQMDHRLRVAHILGVLPVAPAPAQCGILQAQGLHRELAFQHFGDVRPGWCLAEPQGKHCRCCRRRSWRRRRS